MNYELVKVNVPYAGNQLTTFVLMNEEYEPHIPVTMYLSDIARSKSLNTVQSHAYCLKTLVNVIEGQNNLDVLELDTEKLYSYVRQFLIEQKQLVGSSLNIQAYILNSFYDWLSSYDFIAEPPSIKLSSNLKNREFYDPESGKIMSLDKQYLTLNEFNQLCSYVKGEAGSFINLRDELVLMFGYYSGLRAEEAINHEFIDIKRIKDAQKKAEMTRVEGSGFELDIIGKGNKPRTIFVPEVLSEKLSSFFARYYKGKSSGPIITHADDRTKPITDTKHASKLFDATMKALIKDGTVENYERWLRLQQTRVFHGLRHSYATNLATILRLNNLNKTLIQARLGHSDKETTEMYVDFELELFGETSSQLRILENNSHKVDLDGLI
jgi:site-specific recombinase XerD